VTVGALTARPLRLASLVLSVLGILDAGWLTFHHYFGLQLACSGGCDVVQASDQSELLGVPVALLGLLSYLVLIVANWLEGELARVGAALVAIIGVGFSAYLTYESVTDIGRTCPYCLANFAIMILMAIVTVTRLLRED
jgi:uncharacterized membrane protein